jgi:hypothetical protein
MWGSTVPAAIDGLVTSLRAQDTLVGIVHDGPELRDNTRGEVVFVGYTGDEDETAADGSVTRDGLVTDPNRERYSVRCAVMVVNGSSNVAAARNRAYELLAACGDAVTGDQTLAGSVMAARLGDWTFSIGQTDMGAVATITFDVQVDTFTSR